MDQLIARMRAVATVEWAWRLGLAAVLILWLGWVGLVAGVVVAAGSWFLARTRIDGGARCAKCAHAYAEHHGPCQACLRDERDRRLAGATPCSRYERGVSSRAA